MISDRQTQLLKLVVEHFTETSQPVGSKFLVDEGGLDVSGATVRNEMRELEEAGFLTHPHTSAGRVPTEAGYQYYVDHLLLPKEPTKKERDDVDEIIHDFADRERMKAIARYTASRLHAATIISMTNGSVYYTGLSELFGQPEFRDYAHTIEVSSIFDQCEERLPAVDRLMSDNTTVLIGRRNPLGRACSLVGKKVSDNHVFLLLAPMRMQYNRAVGFLNHISQYV